MDRIFLVSASFLALVYAFLNGSNDRANTVATVIKTRALPAGTALLMAGFLNFLGPLFFTAVAKTIAKGIIPPDLITKKMLLAGLIGAIGWSWLATWKGIPVSITHSLVGGILGAGLANLGFAGPEWKILIYKIGLGIVLAPTLGFAGGILTLIALKHINLFLNKWLKNTYSQSNRFLWRWLQVLTSAWLSFTHGMNDGQNAIGIMALAAFISGYNNSISIDLWMILLGGAAIGLGTYISGWRVIKTVGWKMTKLEPIDGCSAELAAGAVLFLKSIWGMPVSTTHVSVSAILGGGAVKQLKGSRIFPKIKRTITTKILIAWALTIPAAVAFGAASYLVFSFI